MISSIPFRALTADQLAAWDAMQRTNQSLDSPFFRPEFTQAVAAVHPDVEVAVFSDTDGTQAFLPYQRKRGNVARPVGDLVSDFHGLIQSSDSPIDVAPLLEACHLSALHFDHLLAGQEAFRQGHWATDGSPYVDTSRGFEAYAQECRQRGCKFLGRIMQKRRKLEREVGPIRFEEATQDKQVLDTLLAWKSEQSRRSRVFNVFDTQWANRLCRNLLDLTDERFSPLIFALYAGDELAAALYCLRSRHVLHGWVTAYNAKFARYSPGSQLFVEVIRAAEGLGIKRFDLGKGDERYKASLKSGVIGVAEGSIDSRVVARSTRYLWFLMHSRVRRSPLRGPLTVPFRWVRSRVHQIQFG